MFVVFQRVCLNEIEVSFVFSNMEREGLRPVLLTLTGNSLVVSSSFSISILHPVFVHAHYNK